jgi:uncharacterized membrane protein
LPTNNEPRRPDSGYSVSRQPFSTAVRVAAGLAVGVVAGLIAAFLAPWQAVPLLAWLAAASTWITSVWISIAPMDNVSTSRNATREDPHGAAADALLLSASLASLGAVVLGILKASHSHGSEKLLLLATGIAAIIASWAVVHTVFTLRYAALYYRHPEGGVNFNEDEKPSYVDFAYLAFTVGMTYQVSDTNLTTKAIRHTALRHALMSYLLGTVIIAATINVAAGLAH